MPQQAKPWIESLDEVPDESDASELVEPLEREEIGYETELPAVKPERDFASPDIGEAFIEDKLLVLREKIFNIQKHIRSNQLMR